MRDTDYATEIKTASLGQGPDGDEARIERLKVKSTGQVEIRLSWWKNGKMVPRPLDLPEASFLKLIAKGIREGVLLPEGSNWPTSESSASHDFHSFLVAPYLRRWVG
jgi:hypothetical protein